MDSNNEEYTKKDKIIIFIIKLPVFLLLIGFSIYIYLYIQYMMLFLLILGFWVFFLVPITLMDKPKYHKICGYSGLAAVLYTSVLMASDIFEEILIPWIPIILLIILQLPNMIFIRELKKNTSS